MTTVRSIAVTGVLACWVVLLASSIVNGQTKTIPGEMVTTTVTVEAIEQSTRTLTVKNDKGIYETIQAGPDVTRFSELKVGDKITVRYYDNVVVRVKKPGEAAVDVDSAALTKGQGQRPAGTAATQKTMTVTITALDPKASVNHGQGTERLQLQPQGGRQEGVQSTEGRGPAGPHLDRGDADLGRSSEEVTLSDGGSHADPPVSLSPLSS